MINIQDVHKEVLLQTVLDTVNDGIIIIDKDLNVVYHNKSMNDRFGDVSGKCCYEAYRGRVEPCEHCILIHVLKDGKQRKILADTVSPSGDVMWMECSAGVLHDDKGEIIGAVEIARNVTEQMRLSNECSTLKREMEKQAKFENIITQSKSLKKIFNLLEKTAATDSSILVTGESGTGKSLIARAIVTNSKRNEKPFISVNCGAIPENLLESELFGHIKGAFTGAIKNKKGLIEEAQGGTLFLDEIAELPLSLQVKLLHFIQDGSCRRVGDTQLRKYDVRLLAATNRDLLEAVKDGVFREDLYFRLNVIPVYLPPLRERPEDIPLLANHILQKLCEKNSRNVNGISSGALKLFMAYSWPGNIRELENVIEFALHLTDDENSISEGNLPPSVHGSQNNNSTNSEILSIEEYTKQTILALQEDHNEDQIAKRLGISRKNLWEKRKKWNLAKPLSKS